MIQGPQNNAFQLFSIRHGTYIISLFSTFFLQFNEVKGPLLKIIVSTLASVYISRACLRIVKSFKIMK